MGTIHRYKLAHAYRWAHGYMGTQRVLHMGKNSGYTWIAASARVIIKAQKSGALSN